ncbi:uracil phosphoribosyltransferase [Acidaminococcus fermentans]|uniref:Uracil phosphoribosyltransferase n=2 Tax=Acidaminococcus fermentans TaxID=905 RepID=D2RP54_ACIFV|nr:uracil phosphoribosyltransferase [Acidaminococcus fermentans]ADB46830.1 uracil phosphoribosyltransferase [Acidaminococcus fermentans DSM 20731]MCI6286973.1 uracil phosphoribosyltransferase [Acidaminococcus fermentans]MCI7194565.1 uracil phosphoribosyltransferase [Acidaminococcus fermentans]MDD6287264.1 uracil phosphoribosyltransferase [Acidaminococcus fermentans]MDD7195765.1 uracil phosphoribosyltransferase [Acidaminococcus fermentans]
MQIHVVNHPLIKEKMTHLRDKKTAPRNFRRLLDEIAQLLLFEVTRDLPIREVPVTTPIAETTGYALDISGITVVPILRAGLGFLDAVLDLIPEARVGHIGLTRDEETLEPIKYYCKIPKDKDAEIILIDPMLATGGSAAAALTMLKEEGYKHFRFMCLVAAPEGVELVNREHPDVPIYTAALDDHLNEHGYIVPGLGDAGDRVFGTVE